MCGDQPCFGSRTHKSSQRLYATDNRPLHLLRGLFMTCVPPHWSPPSELAPHFSSISLLHSCARPRASSASSARTRMTSSSHLSCISAGPVKSVERVTIKLASSLEAAPGVSGCRPDGSCWPSRAWSPTCLTMRRSPQKPWL
ncbi:similar to mKIAA0226 protein (predicted), isoform CRA_c [Rattus norvegicus]|uniref:Similar to mKIAA0226 protein (Predicted), isoform CRA_c n=1 Tax=Rattus norvegicus TaxID=10116 RepID=A6IRN9_RAT|nr:similar to mKIAA0226 protein (predicted), isoform CRA_c [Rattus norvegicus]